MPNYFDYYDPSSIFAIKPRTDLSDWNLSFATSASWIAHDDGHWVHRLPMDQNLRSHGWKLHVSSSLEVSDELLGRVARYCTENIVAFKYLRDSITLAAANAKYADRINSGKFVTIYPRTDDQAEQIARDLRTILRGLEGPRILSDLPLGHPCLHARHGAFTKLVRTSASGVDTYMLGTADGPVVDDRSVFIRLPETPGQHPRFIKEAFDEYESKDRPLPFFATRALRFPNGGGVYEATMPETEGELIVKEGRRHAGLDGIGRDAQTRVLHEGNVLRALGSPYVPTVIQHLEIGDHSYLIETKCPGQTINDWVTSRYPGVRESDIPHEEYLRQAGMIVDSLLDAMVSVWDSGYCHNDLQPENVLVDDAFKVSLIDFESAQNIHGDGNTVQTLGTPGFHDFNLPPSVAQDIFGLRRIFFYLVAINVPLADLSTTGEERLYTIASQTFGAPAIAFLIRSLEKLQIRTETYGIVIDNFKPEAAKLAKREAEHSPTEVVGRDEVRAFGDSLAQAAIANFDQTKHGGFPGDVRRFEGDGSLNLLTGDWGVLSALRQWGSRIPENIRVDIVARTRSHKWSKSGLLDGLAGVTLAAHLFADASLASELYIQYLNTLLNRDTNDGDLTLQSGEAGRLVATLEIARLVAGQSDREALLKAASDQEQRIVDQVQEWQNSNSFPDDLFDEGRSFTEGAAGIAWALTRIVSDFEGERRQRIQSAARALLLAQAAHLQYQSDDKVALYVADRYRLLPYLGRGSLGVAVAVKDYQSTFGQVLSEMPIENLAQVLSYRFTVVSGLLFGRAGMLWASAALSDSSSDADSARERCWAVQHFRGLQAHSVLSNMGEILPGEHNLRAGFDYATGSAGGLIALVALRNRLDGRKVRLSSWLPIPLAGVGGL